MRFAWGLLVLLLVPGLGRADAPVRVNGAADALAAALAKVDPAHAKAGETLLVASIAKPAPRPDEAPVPMALRATIARHGWKVIDGYEQTGTIAITIEAASGVRARIAVGPTGGTIMVIPRPSKTKAPGRCVAIPSATHPVVVHSSGVDQRGEMLHGQTFWEFKTSRLHDVDGDGILDAFVPIAKKHACPEQVSFRVFVVRGSCGHDVGVIGPGSFEPDADRTPLDASGFRPFTMTSRSSKMGARFVPEMTTTRRRFAFAKRSYVQRSVDRRTGRCHHCATWGCTSK